MPLSIPPASRDGHGSPARRSLDDSRCGTYRFKTADLLAGAGRHLEAASLCHSNRHAYSRAGISLQLFGHGVYAGCGSLESRRSLSLLLRLPGLDGLLLKRERYLK